MIRHAGTVLRVEGDLAWVECVRGGACEICPGRHACETAAFSTRTRHQLRVLRAGAQVAPGSEIIIGIPPGAVLRAALLAYGLPLAGLLLGTALGAATLPASAAVGAVAGLAAGIAVSTRSVRFRRADRPVILDTYGS
jgi:sigma-E factor negative regulatory protein RseC